MTVGADLLLFSAGVDSSVLLYMLAGERPLQALFMDYGQRAAAQELAHAQRLCRQREVPLRTLDLAAVGDGFRAGQPFSLHVPVPHRNLAALALGLCLGAQQHAQRLYLGVTADDAARHPSASATFIAHMNRVAAELGEVRIHTPLLALSKAEVIGQGAGRGLDFTRTYSCLLGHPRHCGACPQCRHRRTAFAAAGLPEPADFYRHG